MRTVTELNYLYKQKDINNSLGFTLLEILIALTIFSVMAVLATTSLYSVFHAQDAISRQSKYLNALQITSLHLKNDIEQIVNRPINLSSSEMEFTTNGHVNPLGIFTSSSLLRVKYKFENHKLIRYSELDTSYLDEKEATKEILLKNISSISFHYLDNHYQLQDIWFPRFLPLAIRVDMDTEHFDKISRFFVLPQSTRLVVFLKNGKFEPNH